MVIFPFKCITIYKPFISAWSEILSNKKLENVWLLVDTAIANIEEKKTDFSTHTLGINHYLHIFMSIKKKK